MDIISIDSLVLWIFDSKWFTIWKVAVEVETLVFRQASDDLLLISKWQRVTNHSVHHHPPGTTKAKYEITSCSEIYTYILDTMHKRWNLRWKWMVRT